MLLRRTDFQGTVAYLGGVAPTREWTACWTDFLAYNAECFGPGQIHYDHATVTEHATARNDLVAGMQGEWLLQLDTDHLFEPDLLVRLLCTLETPREDLPGGGRMDVLSGFYQQRVPPYRPCLFHWTDTTPGEEKLLPIARWTEGFPIIQVGSAGAGCLLVRRAVFERIHQELREQPFAIRPPFSEDHSFFLRLLRLGIPAFCDTRIHYWHLRTQKVTERDYDTVSCQPGSSVEHLAWHA